MNIALYHNLPSGGARRAVTEMVKGLVARGHIVDEYCPQTADLTFSPMGEYVRSTVVLSYTPLGVAKRRVPMVTPYLTAARLVWDLHTLENVDQEAANLINRRSYDVVFTHDCQSVLVPNVVRFLQRPIIHYFHVGTRSIVQQPQTPPHASLLNAMKRVYYAPARTLPLWLRRLQIRRNVRAVSHLLTNSAFACSELQDSFGAISQVCYLGVDSERFRPLSIQRGPFVLSVGAVHYHKGYRFLIQALARLPERERPPLIIAANSCEPDELQAIHSLASHLGVNLAVCSVTSEAEMALLYNQAAVFVYSPIREPWGLAAVEAMACGTPVVAVGEGGVAESVVHGETGLLTQRNIAAFADALKCVLSDPGLGARLGAGGRERARGHFTWASTIDRLEATFSAAQES